MQVMHGPGKTHCEDEWKASLTGDPLHEAFSEAISTHPGLSARPVAPERMQEALADMTGRRRKMKSVAYINVPYCETRCLYCLFYIKPYRTPEESRAFADHLIAELQLWADKPVQNADPVHAVYFGGGTPTALEAADIKRVLEAVRKYLPLANDCEITYEGRLSNFGPDRMDACIEGGANRFSLGVQSFDTKVRQAVGRRSTREQLIAQLERLMAYDQAAVVVDLIYGFPYQTMQTWEDDIRICQEIGLDGADCYQLRVFPGSPLYKYIENGKLPAGPDHTLRADMFARSVELMTAGNWRRLSISHWGRTTRERNFYNYLAKARTDCLAFGPGAGGTLHGMSYMLPRKVDEWMKGIDEGVKPVSMLLEAGPNWKISRAVNEHMELNYLNPKQLEKEFPGTPGLAEVWAPLLENWQQAGLVEQQGDFYFLTVAGQFWQTRLSQYLMNRARLVSWAQ